MKRKLTIYLFFFPLIVNLSAQVPQSYTFEFYNASHGLPSSDVLSVAKDAKGFLWIGTSAGLSKYDGYNFHNYAFAKGGELIGYVNVIRADSQERLWIGSGAGLFYCYQDEIIKISIPNASPQGVNDILVDGDTLWLSAESGPALLRISAVDRSGKSKITISDLILKEWALKNSPHPEARSVSHIAKADDGTVFITQPSAIYRFNNPGIELLHTNTDGHDQVLSLFPVNHNKFYFDAAQTEISLWDNGRLTNANHELLYKGGVDEDKPGFWYAGTAGLYYFHPGSGIASRYINTMEQGVLYPSSMLQDENFFWLATHDGLVKIKPALFTAFTFPESVNSNIDYYAILQTRDGRMLFGSNRGKILQKGDTGFSLIKKFLVPTADIRYMIEDTAGNVWAASSYQGLVFIHNDKTEVFTEKDGLADNSVLFLLKTPGNKIYAAGDHGMTEILMQKDNHVSFKKYYYPSSISKHAKFFSAITGPDGRLWAATEEGLVFLQDDSLRLFNLTGSDQPFNFIIKDNKGGVWIAARGGGILQCRFNKKHEPEIIKRYGIQEGLNSLSYTTLLAGKDNNIWAGSSAGLTFIGQEEERTGQVVNYDRSDGFIAPGYSNIALYQDIDNRIWVTTTFGIASFNPADLFVSLSSPLVYITGMRGLKTKQVIDMNLSKPSFHWNNNAFSFDYTALNYSDQEGVQFYYRLDGLDTNWVEAGNIRTVSFASLAPGNYTFRVKAVNNKGRISEHAAAYSFSIRPPFWQTAWFRILATMLVISGTIIYFRSRIKKLKARSHLRQQMTELEVKALRAQMNPHFIFNAMNSIQQFTLKNDVDNANLYISKFSTLLRKVLHSSQQNYITLEEEIEQLNLYLDIEKLRLGNDFSYTIKAGDDLETDALKIPGMLVQPFVENALKHGLAPKEGPQKLTVEFSLPADDKLRVKITDNGIGRKKAQELKQQQDKMLPYQSKGIRLVEERLKLLGSEQAENIIRFEDLYYDDGRPAGTSVSLLIPLHTA